MIKWKIYKSSRNTDVINNFLDILYYKHNRNFNYENHLELLDDDEIHNHIERRKLNAYYSLEAAQDINIMHSIDLEKEFTKILSEEIMKELDNELIKRLNNYEEKNRT